MDSRALDYLPLAAVPLLLFAGRMAKREIHERILFSLSILGPMAVYAALGNIEGIYKVPLALGGSVILLHLGPWQKAQPFRLNLIESILIIAASLGYAAATFFVVLQFREPYALALVIAAFLLIGLGAYWLRRIAAERLSRIT